MSVIFNKIFIMENPILFYVFVILMVLMIIVAFILVCKELKENVNK